MTVKQVERRDKSEKPPALYDLTTLQRDAQPPAGVHGAADAGLSAKTSMKRKLCTYPRTDSRYLTSDMAEGLPVLVNLVANAMPFRKGIAISCDAAAVINDKKVTDHHAVIPTRNIREEDLTALPVGERAILELVALRLLLRCGPALYLCGNCRCCGVRRCGVYRQGPHGEATRLAGAEMPPTGPA